MKSHRAPSVRRSAWLPIVLSLATSAGPGCRSQPAGEAPREAAETAPSVRLKRQDLSLSDRTEWRAVLRWDDACEADFEATRASDDAGVTFYQLSDGLSLVQVMCGAGAYQPTFVLVRLDERSGRAESQVLTLETYESPDGTSVQPVKSMELTGETSVAPDALSLVVLTFSRQTRDCGIWTRYAIEEDGFPRPDEVRSRLPCPEPPNDPVTPDRAPPPGWTMVAPAAR